MTASNTDCDPARFIGWRMVAIAFLAQNCAIGITYGTYGILLEAIQHQYQCSRALAASGLSIMALAMGLSSPMVGSLCQRHSLRSLMVVGAIGNAAGYALLTTAASIEMFLLIFALIIGPSVCLLGIIPPLTLINNWFVQSRGQALGVVSIPMFIFLWPVITAALLQTGETNFVFLTIAAVFVLIVPLCLFVTSRPEDIGQRACGAKDDSQHHAPAPREAESALAIMKTPQFVILSASIGLLTAGGIMLVIHIVPLARSIGLDAERASLLLSALGASGAIGAFLFGWLADRIGGSIAIAVQALCWVVPWLLLLVAGPNFALLLLLAIFMGVCSGGILGLASTTMSQWLGRHNFGRAMGCLYLAKIPFMFAAGPLAGVIFDETGSYTPAILMHATSFAMVGGLMLVYRPREAFGESPQSTMIGTPG